MYRLTVVLNQAAGGADCHVDVNTEDAEKVRGLKDAVARNGFNFKGQRYFTDNIESILAYEIDENGNPGEFV